MPKRRDQHGDLPTSPTPPTPSTGTAANADSFLGGPGTLQSFDRILGGGGYDTLRADTSQNGVQAPTIANVEDLLLDTGGLAFDIANVSGARRIIADGQSLGVTSIAAEDLDIRFGALEVGSGTVALDFNEGALSGSSDTVFLASLASNVTFTSNQTSQLAGVEALNIDLRRGENQVDVSDFSAIQTLTLQGAAPSKVVVSSTELSRIDASATTGGVTVNSDIENDQTVIGGAGNDDFKTGSGDDTFDTGGGDDVVTAGGGNNTIDTGFGADEVTSESGNDTIRTGGGNDTVDSGSGDDVIAGGAGSDRIRAGDGADRVFGNNGNDVLYGQGGADSLFDGAGNDTVFGGGDRDTFYAGQGNDVFFGGADVDTFVFSRGTYGSDQVRDFALTTDAATNDRLIVTVNGETSTLQSQEEFNQFFSQNQQDVTVDDATSTITIDADGGTIELNVSDTDFLMA